MLPFIVLVVEIDDCHNKGKVEVVSGLNNARISSSILGST